jgi:hypothetical protein
VNRPHHHHHRPMSLQRSRSQRSIETSRGGRTLDKLDDVVVVRPPPLNTRQSLLAWQILLDACQRWRSLRKKGECSLS